MKKYLKVSFTFLLLLSLPLLMLFGQQAGEGIRSGLQLAYRAVLPALFPAAVVCGILAELLEYLPLPPNQSLWISAQLCGFPLGIKSVCRAFQRGLIDRKTAIRLSFCASNASPAFLILYVGGRLFGALKVGLVLFAVQCLISFFFAAWSGALNPCTKSIEGQSSITAALGNGISNAALGCLTLTAYICLFSAFAAPLLQFDWFKSLYGFLELSGGIAQAGRKDLLLCSAMVGFSGISVLLQNAAFLAQAQLPVLPSVCGKAVCAVLMPILTFFWLKNSFLTLSAALLLLLFLISFDKYRNRRYNNYIQQRKGERYDLFRRY